MNILLKVFEFQAKQDARQALVQHGLSKGDTRSATFKLPSSDQLSMKRVDPSQLEVSSHPQFPIPPTIHTKSQTRNLPKLFMQAYIKRKMSKEERLEMVKAGREDRGKYQARAAIKQKKVTQSHTFPDMLP
jgi:protein SDA1